MTDPADLMLWPDTVDAFYDDRACSVRSAATRKTWGYTHRMLQRRHPGKAVGSFTTDDLVAFVTQRGWEARRWSSATARNYRIAMQSLFGWAHHAERIPVDPAWRLGQLVRIRRVRTWQPHWLTEGQIVALLRTADDHDLTSKRDRTVLMLGLFAGPRTGDLQRLRWRSVDAAHGVIDLIGKGAKPPTVVMARNFAHSYGQWHTRMRAIDAFVADWPVVPVLAAPRGDAASVVVRQPARGLSIEGIRKSSTAMAPRSGSPISGRTICVAPSGGLPMRAACPSMTAGWCCATTPSPRLRPTSPTTRYACASGCTPSRSASDA